MTVKIKKTLYLPDWIVKMLDTEGDHYDGPGVVASAALNAFCNADTEAKKEILKTYREAEINQAYPKNEADLIVDGAEADLVNSKQKKNRPSLGAG